MIEHCSHQNVIFSSDIMPHYDLTPFIDELLQLMGVLVVALSYVPLCIDLG